MHHRHAFSGQKAWRWCIYMPLFCMLLLDCLVTPLPGTWLSCGVWIRSLHHHYCTSLGFEKGLVWMLWRRHTQALNKRTLLQHYMCVLEASRPDHAAHLRRRAFRGGRAPGNFRAACSHCLFLHGSWRAIPLRTLESTPPPYPITGDHSS